MKFLDLFAGIGGFRLGMERAGHECVGFCEIDPFARKSYKAIHDTKGEIEFHDITAVTDESVRGIGRVDVICGGFPCQAFSIAGKRAGFEDTRGTLFFEIARFASILRPKYLFLENVTGLLKDSAEWLEDNQETFAQAWLFGFEIEQKKLYTVEIPDPNSYCDYRYLSRNDNGICLDASNDTKWKQKKRNQFTESEIKEDFEWAWNEGFAKGVE